MIGAAAAAARRSQVPGVTHARTPPSLASSRHSSLAVRGLRHHHRMSFRDDEIAGLARLAVETWPSQARRAYPHVLAPELAVENLQADVRASARGYFDRHAISWWLSNEERAERKQLGIAEKLPTGHLNSSQVACVNHLEPARVDHDMALTIARNLEPRVVEVRDTGEGATFRSSGSVRAST